MASTFHSIETAKRSLFTQQTALGTTGHNIANANTEGYTRQRVTMTASKPMEAYGLNRSTATGQLGTGVEAASIERIRTAFLDEQYRNESKFLGSWQIQSETLDKLEKVLNEPSDNGIRTVFEKFWSSWSDLSKDPENVTNRQIVKQNALALVDSFNQTSEHLEDLNADLSASIDAKASQANTMIQSISDLNVQIKKIEALGDDANDLRDKRDLLTDKLSKLVNVTVNDTADGYSISMGNSALVNGAVATALTNATLTGAYQSGDLNGGEIFGTIRSRDAYLADFQAQLDTLANTLANGEFQVTIPKGSILPGTTTPLAADTPMTVKGINGLHKLGYTLESPATAGQDFFTFDATAGASGITAASIRLNPAIYTDSNKIATSMRTSTDSSGVTTVIKGNNSLALLMSEAKDAAFKFDQTATGGPVTNATVGNFYNSLVGAIGVQSQEAQRQYDNATAMVAQVDSSRQSVSGVSMDEEMSDMIKFQNAYNAAARFMTTIDEMLEKLINGTGTVGR
ncbi:flagellar hook-associated protein FlgK [Paenibacillus beijingensis]|uniref:Flagellar hook-associated protein 1 n=1 Tax=Paenibacillus beijingensis TaxID=1126833 RepID=A0A0D5NHQ9_9BACL|nr:flagellar hook-associated protein FlgK [Paenibacillus beijingensis]AJY74517.1 flagellar hook protein FlgK [Paenibacillus beijingensis]